MEGGKDCEGRNKWLMDKDARELGICINDLEILSLMYYYFNKIPFAAAIFRLEIHVYHVLGRQSTSCAKCSEYSCHW